MSSRVFFTADTHFGHANILRYSERPFLCGADRAVLDGCGGTWPADSKHRCSAESVALMDDALIDAINETVGPRDTLYHLGDFAFAKSASRTVETFEAYRSRIACRDLHIVWGNHDPPAAKRSGPLAELFTSAAELKEVKVAKQHITLCHYAMMVWNRSHHGSWQLYGHTHSMLEPWQDDTMPGRLSLDVGVDNADRLLGSYRPFAFEEIRELFADRSGFSPTEHRTAGRPA